MILQYFKKKENEYKKKADKIYSISLNSSKKILNDNSFIKVNFDSSFEIIAIILIFYLKILKNNKGNKNNEVGNYLVKNLITDLDNTFREEGIGDMSIGKHVKKYVKKFYYRIKIIDPIIQVNDKNKFTKYVGSLKYVDKDSCNKIAQDLLDVYERIKKNIR